MRFSGHSIELSKQMCGKDPHLAQSRPRIGRAHQRLGKAGTATQAVRRGAVITAGGGLNLVLVNVIKIPPVEFLESLCLGHSALAALQLTELKSQSCSTLRSRAWPSDVPAIA